MKTRSLLILIGAGGLAAGLLLGGLIGHFATKPTTVGSSSSANHNPPPSPSQPNQHNPDAQQTTKHRQLLFDWTSNVELETTLRNLSSKPHLAGSAENRAIANLVEERWKGYGFRTQRDIYNVLLSYPGDKKNRNKAEILASNRSAIYTCQTEEKILDPDQETAKVIPPFNAYAKSGTVESSKVFYLNYCTDRDFKQVQGRISMNGSIIICRYGKVFRGNKVRLAEQHGAVGVIIYNDPYDYAPPSETNATYEGTYPHTRFLPPSGAQRGSMMTGYNGDPLTPGFPSKNYTIRRTVEEVREEGVLRRIPTQPMGYEDGKEFLLLLNDIPDSTTDTLVGWKGSIEGVEYRLGGQLQGGRTVRITNNNKEERRDIANLFGIIEGAVEPDRYVLLGNHYDAWMFGATDALSGTISVLETSRVFSKLLQTGWRPRRTIIFCLWDAEEYSLIGSNEFVEELRSVLQHRTVAYINLDSPVLLPEVFRADGSPLLHNLLYETAKLVPHPNSASESVYDVWLKEEKMVAGVDRPRVHDADAGSDDAGFCHYLGIPTADIMFVGKGNYESGFPLYHTTYATFNNVKKFLDPDFTYHQAVSRFVTEMMRSLADSIIIPFITQDYAIRLQEVYRKLLENTEIINRLSAQNLQGSLENLKKAIDKFEFTALLFDQQVKSVDYSNLYEVRKLNDQLMYLERSFLFPLGILKRSNLKHVIFAPSLHNAYSGTAFPGIVDSLYSDIAADNTEGWNQVKNELTKAIYVIESATKSLHSAALGSLW